jgi:hypothetical protein
VGFISFGVGYLVGRAVSRGAEQRGGFAYQSLAVFLTYSAVAWSFLPMIAEGLAEYAEARKPKAHAEQKKQADAKDVAPGSPVFREGARVRADEAKVATAENMPDGPTTAGGDKPVPAAERP